MVIFLPLAGGTLTGALFGTTANFTSTVSATDFLGNWNGENKAQLLTNVAKTNVDNDFSVAQTLTGIRSSLAALQFLTPINNALPIKTGGLTISNNYNHNAPVNGLYVRGMSIFDNTVTSNVTNAQIDAGSAKTLPTKEWVSANTIKSDFYQEGDLTPVLTGSLIGATYTVGTTVAKYYRSGNVVFFRISLSNINTVGVPDPSSILRIEGFSPVFNGGFATNVGVSSFEGSGQNFINIDAVLNGAISFKLINASTNTLQGHEAKGVTFTNGTIIVSGTYQTTVYTP